MKTFTKIIGAFGICAVFLAMAFIPALATTEGSNEVYNPLVNNYILDIDYDPDNCIVSTNGVSVQQQYTWAGITTILPPPSTRRRPLPTTGPVYFRT